MSTYGKLKTSIKTKIIFKVLVLLMLIVTACISLTVYISITNLREKTSLDLKNKLEKVVHDIELRLEFLKENTELLGNNELIINAFVGEEDREKYLLPLTNSFKKDKYINSLSVLDFDGRSIFQTNKDMPNFSNSEELRLSLSLAETIVYLKGKEKEIVYIVPIKYYDTTQGAIVVAYDMKGIIEKYNKLENYIYLKFFINEFEYYSKNYEDDRNYFVYKDLNIINHTILKNLNIVSEIGIIESIYLEPLQKLIAIILIFTLFTFSFGLWMAYYLATSITNPILELYSRINNIRSENKTKNYVSLSSRDELDELGYAFYKKEQELSELNESLDLKVKDAIKNLEVEKNRFSLAVEGAKDGLWDWDLQTNSIFLSERFELMLGYDIGDIPQNIDGWFKLLHPDDSANTQKDINEYLENKNINETYESVFRLRAKDGSWKWILGRGKAQFDTNGIPKRFVGFNTDISQQVTYQEKLKYTAKHDVLTHLPNRFLLTELLTYAMHTVKRKNLHLALLFIDLDGFKNINDTYGHDAGDEVLATIARRMSEVVRDSDIVARLGGDEFVIVASELKNNSEVIPLLHRLLTYLSAKILYKKQDMNVSASIGVSFYPQLNDIGNEVLLRQADQAMYSAKLLGKNQYQFFNVEASQELEEQQEALVYLRQAMINDEFVLFYQPKVNMINNKVLGFEALLRWNNPKEGLVYPDGFLPLVEHDPSFMIDLGHWVLDHAFFQLESWHLSGQDFSLSVNVSSHEIKQKNFLSYLKKLFDKYPAIKPNTIEIEILESSAFEDFNLTSKILIECQKLGVSIAIDDFGTGYASLHYLKKLPMNTLKVDKSFVIDLLSVSQNLSIVEASIGLAKAFNSTIVAEGVESEEHGKVLLQLGCDIAQGYCISKAIPVENIDDWIKSWKGFPSWELTKPISKDKYSMLYASIEHTNWVNSLEDYINNKTSELPKMSANQCHLGNWILKSSIKEQGKKPEFDELKELHLQLHDYSEKLLLFRKDEYPDGIKKLKEIHKKLLAKIEALMRT